MGDNRRMSIRQTSILLGLLCSLTVAFAENPSLKVNLDQVFAWARDNLEVQLAQKGLIAAQADIVAADHAQFGIPEVKRGLIAGGGGLIRLGKRIPLTIAYEMALTGDPVSAQRAYELGIVNKVVPGTTVVEEALALAARIEANAPLAVRTSKEVMKSSLEISEAASWTINNDKFGMIGRSADAMEGAIAFAEKRTPNWQGK